MSIRRCVVSGIAIVVLACGEDATTPEPASRIEGRYALSWTADRAAPAVTLVPGVARTLDDCGNGAAPPNAAFTFSDSSALTIQEEPQAYALTLVGTVTDCAGGRARFFDVAVGEYVRAEDAWITLMGDLTHPHFDGEIGAGSDTATTIVLRPGRPGLASPLDGVDRLCFTAR